MATGKFTLKTNLAGLLEESGELTYPSILKPIVSDIGKVYTVSLMKTGCEDCEKYHPIRERVATKMERKFNGGVQFDDITVSQNESDLGKKLFLATAYPTVMTLIVVPVAEGVRYVGETSRLTESISERALVSNIDYAFFLAQRAEKKVRSWSSL